MSAVRLAARIGLAVLNLALVAVVFRFAQMLAEAGVVEDVIAALRRDRLLRDTVIVFVVLLVVYSKLVRPLLRSAEDRLSKTRSAQAEQPACFVRREDLRTAEQRMVAARHEAAHTVVAHMLGAHVDSVDITTGTQGEEPLGGMTRYTLDCRPFGTTEGAYRMVMIALAGLAIADLDGEDSLGCEADVTAATGHAARIVAGGQLPSAVRGPLSVDDILDSAREHARGLLEAHLDVVESIAAELLGGATLDHADVERLVPRR